MRPALDLELVRTFLTVVSEGGFKSAATRLRRTPSAVSMQIKRLEELLGHRVLERSNQGIALTNAGQSLLRYGEDLLRQNNALFAGIKGGELSGEIRFGVPEDYAQRLLGKLLPALLREFPTVDPRITSEPSRVLRKLVQVGDVDVAIVARELGSDEGMLLWSEQVEWYGRPTAAHGAKMRVAALSTDCILRDMTLNSLSKARRPHEIVFESTAVSAIAAAVESGFACALLPQASLSDARSTYLIDSVRAEPATTMEFSLIVGPGVARTKRGGIYRRLAAAI